MNHCPECGCVIEDDEEFCSTDCEQNWNAENLICSNCSAQPAPHEIDLSEIAHIEPGKQKGHLCDECRKEFGENGVEQ